MNKVKPGDLVQWIGVGMGGPTGMVISTTRNNAYKGGWCALVMFTGSAEFRTVGLPVLKVLQ